jgi:hypothetical protein
MDSNEMGTVAILTSVALALAGCGGGAQRARHHRAAATMVMQSAALPRHRKRSPAEYRKLL